jgi:hypothetical protein
LLQKEPGISEELTKASSEEEVIQNVSGITLCSKKRRTF